MGKATKRSSAKTNGKTNGKSSTRTTTRTAKPKAAAAATNGNGNGHTPAVAHDRIAQRAYEIWLAKGQPAGLDEQNWREAESELAGARA